MKKTTDSLAAALVIIGGLNWGLVAIAEFDLVATLFADGFGTTSALSRIVYGLVGLAALYYAVAITTARPAAHAAPARA